MENILFVEMIIEESTFRPVGYCLTKTGDVYATSISIEYIQDMRAYGVTDDEDMFYY